MPTHNFWAAMSGEFQNELWQWIKPRDDGSEPPLPVQFPLIADISDATIELFNNIHDSDYLDNAFKKWNAAGRVYRVWSCYINKGGSLTQVRQDVDILLAAYPNDFDITGAWRYDTGAEVGTIGGGVALYPIAPQVVNFMPDVTTDPGDPPDVPPTFGPATVPTDVNLLAGQAPRDFNSYYNPPAQITGSDGDN